MGTSVNQPSPLTTGWAAVAAGYVHSEIPPERVATEIWRAAQSEPGFVDALASPMLFECYRSLQTAVTATDAIDALTGDILRSGNNSVVVEFAKRAAPLAFSTAEPAHLSWRSLLFSQLTDYFVSRDAPGYVGPNGRFDSVSELTAFKKTLKQHVTTAIQTLRADPKTPKQWADFVHAALRKVGG
jgi:hypothetical protein